MTKPFQPDRLALWLVLAALMMIFTALASAYVIRAGLGEQWQPLSLPRYLSAGTLALMLSSVTLGMAGIKYQRSLLTATLLLAVIFLIAQSTAVRQLQAGGNAHAIFYLLIAMLQGVLQAVAIIVLMRVLISGARSWGGISIYWHFLNIVWIIFFLLLFLWR